MIRVITMFFFLLIIGCSGKKKVPSGILPPRQMETVLWDMIRADEFLRDYALKDTSLDDTLERIRLYERVFRVNKTTREQFDTSFSWYRKNPVLLKEMLDTLYARNQVNQEQLYKPAEPDTSNRKDSLVMPDSFGRSLFKKKILKPE